MTRLEKKFSGNMPAVFRILRFYSVASLLLLSQLASAAGQDTVLPGPLVDSEWLLQNLADVKVLDVREETESFTRKAVLAKKRFTGDLKLVRKGAHIPGAVLVDFYNIRSSREINGRNIRYMLPDKKEFEALMQSWGINNDDTVIITSFGGSNSDVTLATRLYWQMKYFGFDRIAILDGGVKQWLLEQKPASIEDTQPQPGNWSATAERQSMLADSDDVDHAITDDQTVLVDTRSLEYYLGVNKRPYVRKRGHIPGAKVFPNALLSTDGTASYFTDSQTFLLLAEKLGIDSNANIITYCNSGQFASASWFAFHELAGNNKVRLYDGSMHQWAIENRKVVKNKME